jgi:uncharacterized membrane protein
MVLALALLQGLAHLIPPLQSPDEVSHFVRIASLVEGRLSPHIHPEQGSGFFFDEGFITVGQAFAPLISQADPTQPAEARARASAQNWTGSLTFAAAPGAAYYPPVIYVPSAIGVWLGKITNLALLPSYHLGRLISQLFCVLVVGLATWIWPPPPLALALLLLPMSLFQMASPVVDGPSHALTMLAMALFLRLMHSDWPPTEAGPQAHWRRRRWALLWCGVLIALVTARLHLLPLLTLPFLLAWKLRCRILLGAALACLASTTGWILWASTTVMDPRVQRAMSTPELTLHYLRNPSEMWGVFERTFADQDRMQWLGETFLGVLGWLDVRLADNVYPALTAGLLGLLVIALIELTRAPAMWFDRMLLLVLALLSGLLSFFLMMVSWSPYPTELIEGVQGRYLIAPALVGAYAFAEPPEATPSQTHPRLAMVWKVLRCIALALLALFTVFSVVATWDALKLRYPAWARGGLW